MNASKMSFVGGKSHTQIIKFYHTIYVISIYKIINSKYSNWDTILI